jgi:hypothetical protein
MTTLKKQGQKQGQEQNKSKSKSKSRSNDNGQRQTQGQKRVQHAKQKPPGGGCFFFFYSISSVWQFWADLLPGFGGYFGVEVVMYQRLLLSFSLEGVDKISTSGGKTL